MDNDLTLDDLVGRVRGAEDDNIREEARDLLRRLDTLKNVEAIPFNVAKDRLVDLAAARLANDLNPFSTTTHRAMDVFRRKIWAPNAELGVITRHQGPVLDVSDYNVNIRSLGPAHVPPRATSTRVTTPTIWTSGLLTFNTVPKIDPTYLTPFEVTLCGLTLALPLLVDSGTWFRMDPRLRLFVRSGRSYFDVQDNATITSQMVDDEHLTEEYVISTLGELLRWSVVEGFLSALRCWDVSTTYHVLGVPTLPNDANLNARHVFLAALCDHARANGSVGLADELHHNVGEAMSNVFAKYEVHLQLFNVGNVDSVVRLDALRQAEQRVYYRDYVMDEDNDN
ncbi:hypothetical protein FOZ60_016045 [Perkinsus olseni]|uniref:Uncharacterized protein n=1 Tax=Perkinsus olseni TaxID=32597 RepID=A0A7J6N7E8_PEROL|nr:hypothetical protein FOZ60_016045 [Perkinsus olseni]